VTKKIKGEIKYKVHWKGFSSEYDEWVAEEDLGKTQEVIDRLKQEAAATLAPRKQGHPRKNIGNDEGTQKTKT